MGALFRPPKIALPQVQPAPEPPILTSPLGLYETKEEKLESLLGK